MSETKEQPKKQTVAEMEEELKRTQLETARLELEERKANLQDVKERLEERQMRREAVRERSRANAITLAQNAARERMAQANCSHRKGGNGLEEYMGGKGQEPQYAVIKHVMFNGDMWIRCMRCGKTWKPPIEDDFYFDGQGQVVAPRDGKFDAAKFEIAWNEYNTAVAFQTKNATSKSVIFQYSDGKKFSRKVMQHTNLR